MLFVIGFGSLTISLLLLIIGFIIEKIQESVFDRKLFKIIKTMAFFGIIFMVFGLFI